jgi:glycosyltransferase involved in cell wall biosynthesis
VAVSQPLAELATRFGATAVTVIENGVDIGRFRPVATHVARRGFTDAGVLPANVLKSGPLLVSVGHLVPRKGFHRVLDVMPRILDEFPDLHFAVVGGAAAPSGNYPARLRHLAGDLDIADRVIFVGPQNPGEVALWINAADVFVLATHHEGSPNVLWEAMACGRPVVASNVGAIASMVPSYAGVVFEDPHNRDNLRAALSTALRRQWDSDRIRAYAECHTWGPVAERVVAEWHVTARTTPAAHDIPASNQSS